MKRKRIFTILVLVLLTCALSTTAFAIDESEVESAIAASSQEEVAGNIFIWFLCAIGFLKVSQKIDSFMASLRSASVSPESMRKTASRWASSPESSNAIPD